MHSFPVRHWKFSRFDWHLGAFPKIMGILNVTPDSFSDGGAWIDPQLAVEHGLKLVEVGADILDIGGESTRPGSEPVTVEEELRRVIPVIERLATATAVPLSIDTTKARVAQEALAAGASIVNDISACRFDAEISKVLQASDCGVILMHMQGTPQTMQNNPQYRDVVAEVSGFLHARVLELETFGIAAERMVVDPGIGFGKTADHNLSLLSQVSAFRSGGRPVLIGHSRKRFLSKVIGRPVEERLAGTIGVAIAVAAQGADLIRVHDVHAVRDALTVWDHIVHGEIGTLPAND